MGLVSNVERAPIHHAITEATAGITSTRVGEVVRGGESMADYKIAAGIDAGKVLSAVDRLPDLQRMWFLVAYAAPLFNSAAQATELYELLLDETQSELLFAGKAIRAQQLDTMHAIIPLVAHSVSRDQQCGANITERTVVTASGSTITLKYVSRVKTVDMIHAIIHAEADRQGIDLATESGLAFSIKRQRSLQAHWARDWEPLVQVMRTVITRIDIAAQNSFRKWLH
ncbi:MAG: hypothetical protein ACRCYN_02585 [Plesiomonas sp.]